MITCRAGITGLNAADNPAPGIPVIRSLKADSSWNGKIYGLGYDALDTGAYNSDLIDEVFLLPYPAEGENMLLQRIRYIAQKTHLEILIPTLDSEIMNFSMIEGELKELGIKMLIPSPYQIKLRSKISLGEFCRKNSFPVPRSITVMNPEQLNKCISELGLPLVIKGIFHGAHTALNLEEARVYYNKIVRQWGIPVIIQEYLSGEEYDVVSLSDRESRLYGAVAMRKLRITEKGTAWAGITVLDEELLKLSSNILEKLKWVGPVELEFMKNSRDGKYYLIEINPRFPSWVYLAAEAGQNLPLAVLRLAAGEKVEPFKSYRTGLTFIRHAVDHVCSIDYLESLALRGELNFNEKERKKSKKETGGKTVKKVRT